MQVVIDIDDGIAQGIIEGQGDAPRNIVRSFQATIADAIKSGIPLPEDHGRLIDADKIVYERECAYTSDGCCTTTSVPNIDATMTIIEAVKRDKEEIQCR